VAAAVTKAPTPVDLLVDAFNEGKNDVVEAVRRIRSDAINRPADPNAKKLTGEEKHAEFQQVMADPVRFESLALESAERFGVPKGQVPRRFVEYLKQGYKETKKRAV
jgi:hypothetical protein